MKTWQIVTGLIIVVLFLMALAFNNLVINNKREYSIINIENRACFLVSNEYSLKKSNNGFSYKLKNNYGDFKILRRPLDPSLTPVKVGLIKSGYKKLINDRVFEYQVATDLTLQDTFVIIKNRQPNLTPLVDRCKELKKAYPTIMEI